MAACSILQGHLYATVKEPSRLVLQSQERRSLWDCAPNKSGGGVQRGSHWLKIRHRERWLELGPSLNPTFEWAEGVGYALGRDTPYSRPFYPP